MECMNSRSCTLYMFYADVLSFYRHILFNVEDSVSRISQDKKFFHMKKKKKKKKNRVTVKSLHV